MKIALLNTAEDMRWLRDVHLPKLASKYKSAVIKGNEDWPDSIEVYEKRNPLVTDQAVTFVPDEEGDFHLQDANCRVGR
jgi:hypothetical protein